MIFKCTINIKQFTCLDWILKEFMSQEKSPLENLYREAKAVGLQHLDPKILLKEFGPWIYAIAVGILYASGFLVLNSNLARSGILDVEFVNARYLLAGLSFLFFIVCFYLFAGRAVLFTPTWLKEDLAWVNRSGRKPFWSIVALIHSLITALFFCCLSTVFFTSIAINNAEFKSFYAVLIGSFFITYTLDVTNFDVKFPRFTTIVKIIIELIALYVFFSLDWSDVTNTVFIIYASIFMFLNFAIDGVARYKKTADRLIYNGMYVVICVFIAAIGYGTTLYGQVSSKIGGARPEFVLLGISAEAQQSIPGQLERASRQFFEGYLVHQTSSYVYIESLGQTIRFRADDVITLVSKSMTK